eukprot:TRINITY_DN20932_c0_g1_i1.p1 TRINITY_DN20932_c0_g1~~TRINITY_DN20932_c0_g1_i1.p1  ORF type:complete len:596 (-),score=125.56 TRINITY_DN20932_c0_g1_i1:131-1918(-)
MADMDQAAYGTGRKALTAGGGGSTVGGGSWVSYTEDYLSRLHGDIEMTTRRLELEQRRLFKLDIDLKSAESEFTQKRQKYKMQQEKNDDAAAQQSSRVRKLERQLDLAIVELNKGNDHNSEMRSKIDQSRKERQLLDSVFRKLEKGIRASGRAIDDLNVSINKDKLAHDEAEQKAAALGKLLEKERRGFHKEVENMKKAILHENEIWSHQEKLNRLGGVDDSGRATGKNFMMADEEEAFSETAMHRRILKISFLNAIQRRHIKQHQKNIEVFEQAFATIRASTGISDIEEIVKIFIHLEQKNYSLLTYVNQLNREIESIEIRNRELQSKMTEHETEEKSVEEKKNTALSEITSQTVKTRAATVEKAKLAEELGSTLDECMPYIRNIVNYLKEDIPKLVSVSYEGDIPRMKNCAPDENETSMNHHLLYLEEALMLFRICLGPDASRIAQMPKQPSGAGTVKKPNNNELPSADFKGDESDDDDTGIDTRPWNRTELENRAQETIKRRRRKPGQATKVGAHDSERRTENEDAAMDPTRRDVQAPKDFSPDRGAVEAGQNGSFTKSPSMLQDKSKDFQGQEGDGGREEMWWRGKGQPKR